MGQLTQHLEIAEAIFEVAGYDEALAEKFGRKAATRY
jgi:hypothetical protein